MFAATGRGRSEAVVHWDEKEKIRIVKEWSREMTMSKNIGRSLNTINFVERVGSVSQVCEEKTVKSMEIFKVTAKANCEHF